MKSAVAVRVQTALVTITLVIAGLALATTAVSVTSDSVAGATASWGPPTEVPGSVGSSRDFTGLSCTGVRACTAVGFDGTYPHNQPVYATETGGSWGPVTQVPGSGGGYGEFDGVSCTGAGECTAVGSDESLVPSHPIYSTETSGVWGPVTEIPGSAGGSGTFTGVSCTGAGECTAVGTDGNNQPVYATETGGVWGAVTEVPGSGGGGGSFSAVSCPAAGECTAVGADDTGDGLPVYATETGGVWGPITETDTGISPPFSGFFSGVSCTGAGECTAVGADGVFLYPSGYGPIYATESGGVWGQVKRASGGIKSTSLNSVSCTGIGACTAVGTDDVNSQFYTPEMPVYAEEIGGAWGSITEVPGSAGGSGTFTGVSCTGAGECTAVGTDGNNGPIYASSVVAAPMISSFSPASGPVGTVVTIKGTALDGATKVSFNGVTGTITKDTPTKIKVAVPAGATTGKIKVFTPGGKAKTATVFTVT